MARAALSGLSAWRVQIENDWRGDARDGSEHALVETEEDVGDLGAADAGLAQHLHETKVGEVSDVGAAGVGEAERVAPEEPLEARDGDRHQRQPYERQRRLATGQAAVEEADARDHEQHEGRRRQDPRDIAGLRWGAVLVAGTDAARVMGCS